MGKKKLYKGWTVDLSKLQNMDHGYFLRPSPDEFSINGVKLTETFIRARAAVKESVTNENEDVSARVRAALADFVAMEDAVIRDLKEITTKGKVSIRSSEDPLLIILKELRNFESHLGTSEISFNKRKLFVGKGHNDSDAKPIELPIEFISNFSWSDFSALRNVRYYEGSLESLEKAFNHFNEAQKHWGITDMLYRGVLTYLNYIKNKFD